MVWHDFSSVSIWSVWVKVDILISSTHQELFRFTFCTGLDKTDLKKKREVLIIRDVLVCIF